MIKWMKNASIYTLSRSSLHEAVSHCLTIAFTTILLRSQGPESIGLVHDNSVLREKLYRDIRIIVPSVPLTRSNSSFPSFINRMNYYPAMGEPIYEVIHSDYSRSYIPFALLCQPTLAPPLQQHVFLDIFLLHGLCESRAFEIISALTTHTCGMMP
jgi:hypothetical protein